VSHRALLGMAALGVAALGAAALVGVAACGSKRDDAPTREPAVAHAATADAGVDVDGCKAAIAEAAAAPPYARAAILMKCTVCGDWKPILDWNRMSADGGPARRDLDLALHSCNAPCDTASTKKLASALDAARGTDMRAPWRVLGESCKDKVSAVPDARNMSAPYFALDRIARAIGARNDDTAKQLASLAIALPAVTLSGVGPVLADGITKVHPAPPNVLTAIRSDLRLGTLPTATLSAAGVTVAGDYPGKPVVDLAKAMRELGNAPIALISPAQSAASALVPAIRGASRFATVVDPKRPSSAPIELAVASPSSPPGWQVPVTIPVALDGKTAAVSIRRIVMTAGVPADDAKGETGRGVRIELDDVTTVADLAKVLASLAGEGIAVVEVVEINSRRD